MCVLFFVDLRTGWPLTWPWPRDGWRTNLLFGVLGYWPTVPDLLPADYHGFTSYSSKDAVLRIVFGCATIFTLLLLPYIRPPRDLSRTSPAWSICLSQGAIVSILLTATAATVIIPASWWQALVLVERTFVDRCGDRHTDLLAATWRNLAIMAALGTTVAMILWREWRSGDRYVRGMRFARWTFRASLCIIVCAILIAVSKGGAPRVGRIGHGWWTAIIFAMTTLLWSLGCRLTLLFARPAYVLRYRTLPTCFWCGYDLRGSEGPPCPECGHPRSTNQALWRQTDTAPAIPGRNYSNRGSENA
ncbi:MAG: hypothetical protein JXB13_07695 [Phycisphaerae bacterium]|nr:hypothetical protein [Phycisphaerae bacterium]